MEVIFDDTTWCKIDSSGALLIVCKEIQKTLCYETFLAYILFTLKSDHGSLY